MHRYINIYIYICIHIFIYMFICTYTYVRNATRRMTDVAGKLSRLLWTHAHISCWSELCVYIFSWPEGASEVIDSIPTQRYLGHPTPSPPPHAICTAVASSRIVPRPPEEDCGTARARETRNCLTPQAACCPSI